MLDITAKFGSVEGKLGCFQFLAITNSAAMNIIGHMSLLYECAIFGILLVYQSLQQPGLQADNPLLYV
ncbi:hypothetical protein H671_8g19183 [Cricetulus griseus]|nr:hypothetical protein H671_8g19183 [Cricetulus griseus]